MEELCALCQPKTVREEAPLSNTNMDILMDTRRGHVQIYETCWVEHEAKNYPDVQTSTGRAARRPTPTWMGNKIIESCGSPRFSKRYRTEWIKSSDSELSRCDDQGNVSTLIARDRGQRWCPDVTRGIFLIDLVTFVTHGWSTCGYWQLQHRSHPSKWRTAFRLFRHR